MNFKTYSILGILVSLFPILLGQNDQYGNVGKSHFASIGDEYGYFSINLFGDSTFETFQTSESSAIARLGLGIWKSIDDSVELVFNQKIEFSNIVDSILTGYNGPFDPHKDTFLLKVIDRNNMPVESFQILSYGSGVSYFYDANYAIGAKHLEIKCDDDRFCNYDFTNKEGMVRFDTQNKDSLDFLSVSFIAKSAYSLSITKIPPVIILKLKLDYSLFWDRGGVVFESKDTFRVHKSWWGKW